MPLESTESSDSSESDEFDLKHLIQSRHLRRALMDKNPSRSVRSGERDDDNVASSSDSLSLNFSKTPSDWTRRSSSTNAPSDWRNGRMYGANTNEYDENDHRDSLQSTRGPYHALQLAADRLTGHLQDDIAQQLESVEEQLEAVGLQMQEAIAAGFKDGTFKSRLRSSDVEPTERELISAINEPPLLGSFSIHNLRDRGSQTSPIGMRYSMHNSTDPFLRSDNEYMIDSQPPDTQQTQGGDDREPYRQSECPLVPGKCEDTQEDAIAASSGRAQQPADDNSGYEYNILKLEGMDPDRNNYSSFKKNRVSGDSTPSDKSHKTGAKARVYQARGCQTCRCHSCRVPSDPVQTVQIVGVVSDSQGESSAPGPREFVTMDVRNGRIPQSLGLIEICRDYEAQQGQYEHIWKQASVLQQFNVERSSNEVLPMFSPIEDRQSQLHVERSYKQLEPGGNSKRNLHEGDQSSKEKSEEPVTGKWQNSILKSKFLRERSSSLKAAGIQELGSGYSEPDYPAGQSSPAVNRVDRTMVEPSCYRPSSSDRSHDSSRNIRSEIYSVVDNEVDYTANHGTDDSLEVDEGVGKSRTPQEHIYSLKTEQNLGIPDSHSVLQIPRNSSAPSQQIVAQGVRNPNLEAVKIQGEQILNGPRCSPNKDRHGISIFNPENQPQYGTRSWNHLKQQSDHMHSPTLDLDDRSNWTGEETKVRQRPNEESSNSVDGNRKLEFRTEPGSGTKAPFVASRSSYEIKPRVGGVSLNCLPSGTLERSSLDAALDKPRTDTQPRISEKRGKMEKDEAPNRPVAQSRVYIDIRQEYEPGDHVSRKEMQTRMQNEIAKEFALLGIHSQFPSSRRSIRSKSESELPGPTNYSPQYRNAVHPEIFKLDKGSSSLNNLYSEDSDLRSRAGQMFSPDGVPAQVYDIPPQYSSPGHIVDGREVISAQPLDNGQVSLGSRASVTQRLAAVRGSKRRSKSAQRPRFDVDDIVEPHTADRNTNVTDRRPTPYPLSLSAKARLRKEDFQRLFQDTQKLEDSYPQQPLEGMQESEQTNYAAGSGEISVTKASGSSDYQGPDITRRGDALVQILSKKSSRPCNGRKSKQTSVRHIISNIPKGRCLFVQPVSELVGSKSRQNSIAQMEKDPNMVTGIRDMESLDSSIPTNSRQKALRDIPNTFPDSRTRESQEQEPSGGHPTMLDQRWNDTSNLDDDERNAQKLAKRNLKTLNSKSSQKYLAKMLTRLSQKLGVLESKGLIESRTPQHPEGFDSQKLPLSESLESEGNDWSSGHSKRRQLSVESELQNQFDHQHLRKSQDFTNFMRRRSSQWPFQKDLKINTKDTSSSGLVDDKYIHDSRKIPETLDTSLRRSHQSRRASMLANNLELLSEEMVSRRNQRSKKQELQEEWQPGTPHSLSSRDHNEEMKAKRNRHAEEERSENNTNRADHSLTSQRDLQSRMSPSHNRGRMTENWQSRNRQSIQTQMLERISSQDERKFRDGHDQEQVFLRPSIHHGTSNSSDPFRRLQYPLYSEESLWERSLESSNPQSSNAGQPRLQADDVVTTNDPFQGQRRKGTSAQIDEFGFTGPPSFELGFQGYHPSQRIDSMETEPGDLELPGLQYFQHRVPQQADSLHLKGQQHSRICQGMESMSRRHPMSQSEKIRSSQLVFEEEKLGNQLSQNEVPEQSHLEYMVSRSRHLPHIQIMDGMGARHETKSRMGAMNGVNSTKQHSHLPMSQDSQVERMHSFAVQPESRKSGYETPDTSSMNRLHFEDDRMNSSVLQPEIMNSGIHHHFRSRRPYRHPMHPDDLDSGFPHHSQSGRMYSYPLHSEEMTLGIRPSHQNGGMYSNKVQSEATESSHRLGPHIGGDYGFAEHSETNQSQRLHPSERVKISNLRVQPEGLDAGFRHHIYDRIYTSPVHAEKPAIMNTVSRVASQGGRMANLPVHPADAESESRHLSHTDLMHGFAGRPQDMQLERRRPSELQRVQGLQPEALNGGRDHPSDTDRIRRFAVQPEVLDARSRRPSERMNILVAQPEPTSSHSHHSFEKERVYRSLVQESSSESGSSDSSETERMHSFAVQPKIINSGSQPTSQKRVPGIRKSQHSVVRMPENRIEDFEDLGRERGGTENKTSSPSHPMNDLPPEVLSLGSKNPRKSSKFKVLNDKLQDLEATVSKSHQNSQARMKRHTVHELGAVARRQSKMLSKNKKIRDHEEEHSNLEGTEEENYELFHGESEHLKTEKSESHDKTPEIFHQAKFDSDQLEYHPGEVDGESIRIFESKLFETQPMFEDETHGSYSSGGEILDLHEDEESGTSQSTTDYRSEEPSVVEQENQLTNLEDSSRAVEGSDHHDGHGPLLSRRSDNSNRSSSHSSRGTTTSSSKSHSKDEPTKYGLTSHSKDEPTTSSFKNWGPSQQEGRERGSHAPTKDVSRPSRLKSHSKDEPSKYSLKSHSKDEPSTSRSKSWLPSQHEGRERGSQAPTKDVSRPSMLKSHSKDEPSKSSLKSHWKDDPRRSSLRSHWKDDPRRSSLKIHSMDEPRKSSFNSHSKNERRIYSSKSGGGSILQGSKRRSQSEMKNTARHHEETEPELQQTSDFMPEELDTPETFDSGYPAEDLTSLETGGEELVSLETELVSRETEGQEFVSLETEGEELVSLETEAGERTPLETRGEELTPHETGYENDSRNSPAEALETAERHVTPRVVDHKDPRLTAKARKFDKISKDFINPATSSLRNSKYT